MIKKTTLSHRPWASNEALKTLCAIFAEAEAQLYIVGGAVREAIMTPNKQYKDIDLATSLPPLYVKELLRAHKIPVIPTGEKYGTITARVNKQSFEITTMRKDLDTDGRRAKVVYTENIAEDAQRRDFTFNALYSTFDGLVLDPTGMGLEDALDKTLRFIGEPRLRLQEDYLRLLRFFRFISTAPIRNIDGPSLEACIKEKENLAKLSKERIIQELYKLLVGSNALQVAEMLTKHNILGSILPPITTDILAFILSLHQPHPPHFLFFTLFAEPKQFIDLLPSWPFSNDEKKFFKHLFAHSQPQEFSVIDLYTYGKTYYMYTRLLQAAHLVLDFPHKAKSIKEDLQEELTKIQKWQRPVFPINGLDLIAHGLQASPELGERLRVTERWWAEQDFAPSKQECLLHAMARK